MMQQHTQLSFLRSGGSRHTHTDLLYGPIAQPTTQKCQSMQHLIYCQTGAVHRGYSQIGLHAVWDKLTVITKTNWAAPTHLHKDRLHGFNTCATPTLCSVSCRLFLIEMQVVMILQPLSLRCGVWFDCNCMQVHVGNYNCLVFRFSAALASRGAFYDFSLSVIFTGVPSRLWLRYQRTRTLTRHGLTYAADRAEVIRICASLI